MRILHYATLILVFLTTTLNLNAQWQTSDNNIFYKNGNVGIGTSQPQYNLHVKGKLYLEPQSGANGWYSSYLYWWGHSLVMGSPIGAYTYNSIDLKPGGADQGYLYSQLRLYTALNRDQHELNIQLKSKGESFFNGGNVGIGTSSPDYHLDVIGTIRAHQVLVNTQKGADFVFDDSYNLRTLEELEQFFSENKHLPEIAPASDMEQNGVNMGELQIQLLQKIEELTLYIVKQDKQIKELQKRFDLVEINN